MDFFFKKPENSEQKVDRNPTPARIARQELIHEYFRLREQEKTLKKVDSLGTLKVKALCRQWQATPVNQNVLNFGGCANFWDDDQHKGSSVSIHLILHSQDCTVE